jgi:hypothetical protein
MKRLFTGLFLILAAHLGGRFSVQAAISPDQFNQSTAFLAGALTEFFTDSRTFTATTELTVQNVGDEDSRVVLRFGSAFDGGKMRLDLNLKSQLNGTLGSGLPELGIDRVNFMLYPDHPVRIVFPSQQSYVEVPLSQAVSPELKDAAGGVASQQVKKFVGNETAVGVPARKYQLHADGAAKTAYLWEAPAMKDMPVQIRVQAGGMIYNFAFRNVRQGPVDPRVFGIPATFKKQGSSLDIVKMGLSKMTEQLNATIPQ